jgi:hypothetical protein
MTNALRAFLDRRRLRLCVLGVIPFFACASLQESDARDIAVVELPFVANPIAWMDNETLLLEEYTGKIVTRHNGARVRVFHLTSYNYKSGKRHDYGRVGTELCYADGYVSHGMRPDDEEEHVIVVYGELGKEVKRRIKPGQLAFDRGARGSCRPWTERPARPSWANEKTTIWYLWPRLGVIDCQTWAVSPLTRNIKARFHRPDDDVGTELPFSCEEVSGYNALRYYQFKGAYFAFEFDYRHPWPEGRGRRAFWLYPDGRVETLTFSYSKAIRNTAIPVVDGILAFSRPDNRKDDYWVYFLKPDSSKRLYRGEATGITSPDGCKVAMLIDPDFKARVQSRNVKTPVFLKVLDFCRTR